MSAPIRSLAERLARRTETRRSLLGRLATSGLAVFASLAANASIVSLASAQTCCCDPPCGQNCMDFVSCGCSTHAECQAGCEPYLGFYPTSGGCWSDSCGCACCDCSCFGNQGNPSCYNGSNFLCGCWSEYGCDRAVKAA